MTQPRPRRKVFARQGRAPRAREWGALANHAQGLRLRPTYNKALLEPQQRAWPPTTPSSSLGRTRMHCS